VARSISSLMSSCVFTLLKTRARLPSFPPAEEEKDDHDCSNYRCQDSDRV
jgi:hypothetical protein